MEGPEFSSTQEGTPQGGVISPLLANIALHGMETAVQQAFTSRAGKPTLIRYADDFLVLHPLLAGVERAKETVEAWLKDLGLELKPSKTRITHTLHGKDGVTFLGFNVRQYPVGKTHSGTSMHGTPLGFKTLIKPSPEAIREHVRALGQIVRKRHGAPPEALIERLTPLIRGWTNYYRTVVAKAIFAECDYKLHSMLRHWTRHRHPHQSARWI